MAPKVWDRPPCAAASFAGGCALESGLLERPVGKWPARGDALIADWALSAMEARKLGTGMMG